MRGEVEGILNDTATNLGLTSDALQQAVREYAKTDSDAAAELEWRQGQHRAGTQSLDQGDSR